MDCLDRTNVVQTALARRVLEIQLAKVMGAARRTNKSIFGEFLPMIIAIPLDETIAFVLFVNPFKMGGCKKIKMKD